MPETDEEGKTQAGDRGVATVDMGDPQNASAPLNIIRTETVLSKLPIHNLAKKGRVDIRILKKNDHGQIELRWEVSYNDRYGQPRQLAYKLDTIVVNQRIEEEGRPLPKIIRLGSLSYLCSEFDLPASGKNTNDLKKAFLQNASAFITAKLRYKGNDGTERTLEAGFTRYSVVFTGEKLPNGQRADAVYLILNQPYWEVLNNAPYRPLDRSYMKTLKPAPQRFYEIISRIFYTAIKYRHKHARLLYSEFCMYSALTRHYDYENFRVQMAKIHRPHLKSAYIAAVYYEQTTDTDGNIDWIMYYTPGPKAHAEYRIFNRKRLIESDTAGETIDAEPEKPKAQARRAPVGESQAVKPEPPAAARERQRPLNFDQQPPAASGEGIDLALLAELTKRGIHEPAARDLLKNLAPGQRVLDQLEYGDWIIKQDPTKIKKPAAYYRWLVEQNVTTFDPGFEPSRTRAEREEQERAARAAQEAKAKLERHYYEYRDQALKNYIQQNYPGDQYEALISATLPQMLSDPQYKYARDWPEKIQRAQAETHLVLPEIRKHITFLTPEAFAALPEAERERLANEGGGDRGAGESQPAAPDQLTAQAPTITPPAESASAAGQPALTPTANDQASQPAGEPPAPSIPTETDPVLS